MCLSVYVGVCTQVLVPMEARDIRYPGAVTQLVCEGPNRHPLQEWYKCLHTGPSLQPLMSQP